MPESLPWDHFENRLAISPDSQTTVHVLGAGLAGCWMARTLAETGVSVVVLEAGPKAANAASANPAGIIKPLVSRTPNLTTHFHIDAHRYLLERLADWGLSELCQHAACGVVQLIKQPFPASEHYSRLSSEDMSDALGVACDSQGILFEQSGWLNPSALCSALLRHPLIELQTECAVQSIQRIDDEQCWSVIASNQTCLRTSHLVIATGALLNNFAQTEKLGITPARGQISRFARKPDSASLRRVVDGGHYIIPDGNTFIVGATFERGVTDKDIRADDNHLNLNGLRDTLDAVHVVTEPLEAFAGIRATTPDRLPVVGPLPDFETSETVYADLHYGRNLNDYPPLPILPGAYVLGGLGSRGIVTAPFAASLLSDFMLGGNRIASWSAILNPARFLIRNLKRKISTG